MTTTQPDSAGADQAPLVPRAPAAGADPDGASPRTRRALTIAGFAVLFLLALAARASLLGFESFDYQIYYTHWYDALDEGGAAALGDDFANYNPPYLYLLYLATLLPVPELVAIKCIGMLFDLVLAGAVVLLVRHFRRGGVAAPLAGAATLFLPTVTLNSAMWAQCDSIYVSFLVLALWAALQRRSALVWALFGAALAFKLQAVFFLPVLVLYAVNTRFRLQHVLAAVGVFVAMMLPALAAGRSAASTFGVYVGQTQEWSYLSLNAASLYAWLPDSLFAYANPAGVAFGAGVVGLVVVAALQRPPKDDVEVVAMAAFLLLLVPFVLPQMHDRYSYGAEVLVLVLAFLRPQLAWTAVVLQVVGLFVYSQTLLERFVFPESVLSVAVLVVLVALGRFLLLRGAAVEEVRGAQPRSSSR